MNSIVLQIRDTLNMWFTREVRENMEALAVTIFVVGVVFLLTHI